MDFINNLMRVFLLKTVNTVAYILSDNMDGQFLLKSITFLAKTKPLFCFSYHLQHYVYLKQLKKIHRTPDFPPKRLRNTGQKVLDERRSALEAYLHHFTRLEDEIPEPLLRFLEIRKYGFTLNKF